MVVKATDPRFIEYREDGFPLCPVCEEDELYSLVVFEFARLYARDQTTPQPTLANCLSGEFCCYYCRWRG